jgi:hypothetical protein
MNSKIISYSAGLANIIGISIFSKLLTNNKLGELDPLFNYIGNILIMLWGFVYIFTKRTYKNPLMIIFFLEKMVYVFNFFYKKINLSGADLLTKLFLSIYGYIDLVFGISFIMMYYLNLDN